MSLVVPRFKALSWIHPTAGNVFCYFILRFLSLGFQIQDVIYKLYSCCLGFQASIVHAASEIIFYKRTSISQETENPEEPVSQ